jgi:hypothetical protein
VIHRPQTARAEGLKEGLLWHDAGEGDLAGKVEAAAGRYEEKFGVKPDTCHVHPIMLAKDVTMPRRVGRSGCWAIPVSCRTTSGWAWLAR